MVKMYCICIIYQVFYSLSLSLSEQSVWEMLTSGLLFLTADNVPEANKASLDFKIVHALVEWAVKY